MIKRKVSKVFLFSLILALTVLPFYLLWDYFVLAYKFFYPDFSKLKSESGITSILVLGKGGEGHTAPDLTDTIMDVFISVPNKKISLLPIPRDIWISETKAKINSSYYWDKERGNENFNFTNNSIQLITGYKPNYMVVVDFNMFKDLVNALGGIDVMVENSFTDQKFPIPGRENDLCSGDRTYACRYESISFEKGIQKMDGETALKFVRSRNAEGDEGTDLAREARQQKVIEAIKNKVLSQNVLLNPRRLSAVISSVSNNIETNIDFDTAIILAKLVYDSKDNIQSLLIPEDFLTVSNNSYKYDYQYVFIPRTGTWKDFSITLPNQIY